jgi:hypothetical protein
MWVWSIVIFNLVALTIFLSYGLFGIEINQGGVCSYLIIFCVFFFKLLYKKKHKYFLKIGILDILIIFYITWNLITFINVLLLDRSTIVYVKGITYSLFPIWGYFIFSFQEKDNQLQIINNFIGILILSTSFIIISGVILFFLAPEFYFRYILYLYSEFNLTKEEIFITRLVSYFGNSAVVGNISVISIPLILYLKKQNIKYFNSNIAVLFLIIVYMGVILSFSRSAWTAAIIITLFNILMGFKKHFLKIMTIMGILSVLLITNISTKSSTDNIDNKYLYELQNKVSKIPESFSERLNQIEYALAIIDQYPLGIGLGQAGHKSFVADKETGVYDNNFFRIFAETGIVGFILFCSIIFYSFLFMINYLFNNNFNFNLIITTSCVLFIFYFQALGTNIFDLHYSSFLFWSFVGIFSSISKERKNIQPRIYIEGFYKNNLSLKENYQR